MLDRRSDRIGARSLPLLLLLLSAGAAWSAPRPEPATQPAALAGEARSADRAQLARFEHALTTDDGLIQVMIELEDPPAAVVFAAAMEGRSRTDAAARRAAGQAAQAHVGKLRAAQSSVAAAMARLPGARREVFRVQKAFNGISVAVAPDQVAALERLPGVRRVLPVYPEYPTNSTSVPFIGTPNVWANTIGLPAGALGSGISIGVIDTGVDYLHASFGGTADDAADYTAEGTATTNFTTTSALFPSAKVVGGTDLAGDLYTGGNAPVPDANPMDCNGHGSHVSGTAAGVGVTAAGAPFTGPYDASPATYSALRIGPGTAPMASLYGVRVFGCGGSTGLTVAAIDWTMDPNNDDDLSDHLDVINMSLGSNFGSVLNTSSIASDNAALAGVIVVTSAGNAGDTFFISGSPGAATRAIATANSVDDAIAAVSVTVNSPAGIAGNYLGGAALYGPAPTGQTADSVIALDPIAVEPGCTTPGPLATDACCALTNAAAIAGNICVVDRGTCSFKTKTLNCQNAGAIGVVVVDNAPGSPPPGMADDALIVTPITIPSERVTLADGTLIKNTITSTPPVNITLNGASGADTLSSSSSRGPRRIFGSPLALKPDIAAPGTNITSVLTGKTCTGVAPSTGCLVPNAGGFFPDSQPLSISGTSMASPHVAGIMALLLELNPDWSVEELKALVMNYALEDVFLFPNDTPPQFPPSRIGAGRVEPADAALGEVIAYNADDVGAVSVTFEQEVVATGVVNRTKRVRVVNKGDTSRSFDLAIDTVLDSPGVSFSLPGGSSVTVPAGGNVVIDVQMTADASLMEHTRDPSLFPTQGIQVNYGDQPRNFLSEEGAYLTFTPPGPRTASAPPIELRLPLYMAERPASTMSAADTIVTGGAGTGSTTIALSGSHLCSGTVSAGPTCTGSFPPDIVSLVSPFELQVVSGVDPVSSTDYADIQYVGVSFLPSPTTPDLNNDLVLFGISSWGDWSTLNDVAYNVCIDGNEDGTYERILINTNPAIFVAGASFNDNFVRVSRRISDNQTTILGAGSLVNLVNPTLIDTALHLNNVMILGASPSVMAMTAGDTTFRYKVVTCPATNSACSDPAAPANALCNANPGTFFDQAAGPFFYNWAAQGLSFALGATPSGNFLDEDLNGNTLPVSWNTANMATNGSVGALLLHHHNTRGTRAEVVLLEGAPSADYSVTTIVNDPNPDQGDDVTFTVTVTNNGPDAAVGVVVNFPLTAGLDWVSDDSAGAYAPGTGLWTVGALASAASATLNVTATVVAPGQQCNQAQVTSLTPLDADPSDNQSTVCIAAPEQADLSVEVTVPFSEPEIGDPVTFTVEVENLGPDTASSVVVEVDFPGFGAVTITGSTETAGLFDQGTGLWTLALPSGSSETLTVTVDAPPTPPEVLTAEVTVSAVQPDPDTSNNTDTAGLVIGGYYYSLAACRLVDTRLADGPYGGPAVSAGGTRDFDGDGGSCSIPADVRALAINVTAVTPTATGHLRAFETGVTMPLTTILNFNSGVTRANNAVVEVNADGSFTVFNSAGAPTHVLIDVVGYFQ